MAMFLKLEKYINRPPFKRKILWPFPTQQRCKHFYYDATQLRTKVKPSVN